MEQNLILGIDVGIAITGWAIVEKDLKYKNNLHLYDYGAILTEAGQSTPNRLNTIFEELTSIIEKFGPTVMAIESLFYFKNQKTIINVSQARGVMLLVAAMKGLITYDYTPLQVKTAVTGYGRADKKQIQRMIKLIYGLKEIPKPDDAADAIAVATCHINTY